jgi:drug/metabolite transporter (DMT)-like permease
MEQLKNKNAHSLKFTPAALLALAAAALYSLNIPFSKLLLASVPPAMLAAFLYLGAGAGMATTRAFGRRARSSEPPLTRRELPYVLAMIALDIAAPILLMFGLRSTAAETASLLGSFEIVATAAVALAFFSEKVSRRLWAAIALITLASLLLSLDGTTKFEFSPGALLVLAACVCWGFENNCTRKLSSKSAAEIVTVKGLFSGAGSLLVALLLKEAFPPLKLIIAALALGFVAYGMSIFFYIRAQKELGAAKTSVYYAAAPFIGVLFSLLIFRELPGWRFLPALALMLAGTILSATDAIHTQHTHEHVHVHTHAHMHGGVVHTHPHEHAHTHLHVHGANPDEPHEHVHSNLEGHDHVHADTNKQDDPRENN